MNSGTLAALVMAAIAILGAIGSVLLLAVRVGRIMGVNEAFMTYSKEERQGLRNDLTRTSDRLSLHIEHHNTA